MFLREFLHNNFSCASVFPHTTVDKLLESPKINIDKYQLYYGHFGLSLFNFLKSRPITLTFLRDPYKRLVSQINHLSCGEGFEFVSDNDRANLLNIDQLEDLTLLPLLINTQTFYLGYNKIELNLFSKTGLKSKDIVEILTDDSLLRAAKHEISKFEFVGTLDNLESSIELLCYKLNIPKQFINNPVNQSLFKSKFSTSEIECLLRYNNNDQIIYDFAVDIFNDMYKKYYDELKEDYVFKSFKNIKPISADIYHFDCKLIGSGWHSPEIIDGNSYRWTGPDPVSTLYTKLVKGASYLMHLTLNAHQEYIVDNLSVYLNGSELHKESVHLHNNQQPAMRYVRLLIDVAQINECDGICRFEFAVPYTISHKQIDPQSDDSRVVGLYFHSIEIIQVYADN